jgi:hypothetical protein
MMEEGSNAEGPGSSQRPARLLHPEVKSATELHGLELVEVRVEPLELDDLLLEAWGAEVRISIVAKGTGCAP